MFDELLNKANSWKKKTDAENVSINISYLKENVLPLKHINLNTIPWVFSHIPKTAGTSAESYLAQAFELKDTLHINAPDLNRLPQVMYLKNKFPQLIMGHHPIHALLYQLLPNTKIVHLSMMREPISRTLSYYNYITTREYHALHQQVKNLNFDNFLAQNSMVELHNGQAKRLSGHLHSQETISDNDLYFKAKYVIDNCFSLIGVTEYFKQFHQLIAKQCGISFKELPPINRSKIKVQLRDLDRKQLMKIKENNRVDIQLYDYVKSKFLENI